MPTTDQAVLDRHQQAVEAEISRYPGLIPGAASHLAGIWRDQGGLPPAMLAAKIAELMALPVARRYIDPEWTEPTLANGKPQSPLRQVLSRHAADLKPGAIDALLKEWGVALAGMTGPQLAGEVARRLESRDFREKYSRRPPEVPRNEARVAAIIRENYHDLDSDVAGRMARDIVKTSYSPRPHEVVRAVARMRITPKEYSPWGVEPLAADDWRRDPHAPNVGEPRGFEAEAAAAEARPRMFSL